MASSSDITEVKEIVLEISKNPLTVSVQSDLQDEEKRWLIVGICLHSVISPVLRKFIEPVVKKLYKKLKKGHRIDTQTYPNVLLEYPQPPHPKPYKLNYESINNNSQHGKKRQKATLFDYKVTNDVDLSKLFILPHMAHYSGFNDSCDSSVLLGLIINLDYKFQQPLKVVAEKARKEIRNEWAHCNFRDWDTMKFMQSFQIMNQLVKDLQLPPQEEMDTLGRLTRWQCTGHQLLSGTTIGLELLKDVKTEEAALAKYLLHVSAIADKTDSDLSDLLKAFDEVSRIDKSLSLTISRIEKLEKAQCQIGSSLSGLGQKHENLEKTVENQDENIRGITSSLNNVTENVESVRHECAASKKGLQSKVDALTERVSHIEYYTSLNKPDKVFFYTPQRNSCFVGRKEELVQLESFLCTNDENDMYFVSGLGGSGKTSFAIEFSWLMQNYFQGGLFWISGENTASFKEDVARLANTAATVGNDSHETLIRTLEWLSNLTEKWLLVVDNVDEEDLSNNIKELLFGGWKRRSKGHILVTTRREPKEIEETFKVELDKCIVLGPMTDTESIDFMLKRTEKRISDEHLDQLVQELQGLPLAMEQAASCIKTVGCSFEEYLTRFNRKRLKLYQRPIKTTYDISKERLTVRTTWRLNFEYICKESEDEGLGDSVQYAMNVAAYFFGDDIPEEIFNVGEPVIDNDDLKDAFGDGAGVKQVIAILTRFSLFQRSREGSVQVHRLVQEVVRDSLTDVNAKLDVLHAAIKMLNSALQSTKSPNDVLEVHDGTN